MILKPKKLDQLGITASLACALHCAALPFLITSLPLLGLGFLSNSWVEISMIFISMLLGFYSLLTSYPAHKRITPLLVLIIGFTLIGSGHYLIEGLEGLLIPLGGLSIAGAHFLNWKYNKSCCV
ncbi:MAG TPA: MerC domain-containing protein [Pedobacter sp.]|uniref:MerC domain-containing protein n=1 Tax=Pedobacter sp. TaxID=1411316 RepID=UPI002B7E1E32|nr:MerC domain-containing protein [Pedobacter sp.]HMI01926.1 MerC domain-containing protein [Pedobacter sp.]